MGVKRYKTKKGWRFKIDERIKMPDGTERRLRRQDIASRELAQDAITTARADALMDRWFGDREKPKTDYTVTDLWKNYEPASKRKRSGGDDAIRAKHLKRHLGDVKVIGQLSLADVERYRTARAKETTPRDTPPETSTVNRELSLLRRILNYAVECELIERNPLVKLKLLEEDNVREMVVDDELFEALVAAAPKYLKAILTFAYDTGMRRREIFELRWAEVDLERGIITLPGRRTKGKSSRLVPLTSWALGVLKSLPRYDDCEFVFVNPRTKRPWNSLKRSFRTATKEAGLEGLWLHDLRRSFVTKARRALVPESEVMKITGHRTRAVFDRYNIIDESDLRSAIDRIESARAQRSTDEFGQ